ncbi:peptidoglycan recognition protein family protein [Thermoflavimicrobium dichotomicum]|uniref:N-acetylmuramoyl-L-alanine amidase domain-containing protein n=1 Tax=Thermoflavimicrobium dichotomicum TaxID=46223 RepID=A0A1I3TJM9_9BACL|nr:peptidoglycan recognition family protein [Thermoflavimicrobium dichotomicum]SFJ69717.1 hypothetical protein SAMN05421852_11755 [Thermoflavimicrobium dichotomicum]
MGWQYGLLFDTAEEFIGYIRDKQQARYPEVHVHGTWQPDFADFTGSNHLELQDAMKRFHTIDRGWDDIAQHITIFPDGKIVTGRDINVPPASAVGNNDPDDDNTHPFMFEMVGNFDVGHDKLDGDQLDTALKICRFFSEKQGAVIRFHNEMTDKKTCPGSGIDKGWFVDLICLSWTPTSLLAYTVESIYDSNPSFHRFLYLKNPMFFGEDVKQLQLRLKTIPDGIFGVNTLKALLHWKACNQWNGTEPKEIVTQEVWQAIFCS